MRLAGKTTVITGASSGIGRCLAVAVSRRRGAPVLLARRGSLLAEVARDLATRFPAAPRALVAPCDVCDRASVREALDRARARRGPIDVLINNAAISLYGLAERTEPADLQSVLQVNLLGPLHGMLEVIPEMRDRGRGVIVNVISAAALRGVPYLAAYGAAKAALAAFGQSLRAELADTGVRVLNVYPGYTRTPLFGRERLVGGARRPDGRYAAPEDVARAIVRAIEARRTELVLSREGKALGAAARLAPRLLDRVLARVARRLRIQDADRRPVHGVARPRANTEAPPPPGGSPARGRLVEQTTRVG